MKILCDGLGRGLRSQHVVIEVGLVLSHLSMIIEMVEIYFMKDVLDGNILLVILSDIVRLYLLNVIFDIPYAVTLMIP